MWAEIDQYTTESGVLAAGTVGSIQQDLMIHPAKNLLDGQRYIVALRDLHTNSGTLARPNSAFESYVHAYLDPTAHPSSGDTLGNASDPRTSHMDRIFDDLAEAGWTVSSNPSQLYLAWDFTTASTQNVTGRLLSIRDNAFEQLGETKAQIDAGEDVGSAPHLTVTSVTDFQDSDPSASNYNALVAREIQGSFTVPCYIAPTCSPPIKCDQISGESPFDDCPSPGTFYYTDPTDPDDDPSQVPGQTYTADYICVAGRNAFDAGKPLRPVEYGHGLFGVLNFLYLQRLMINPGGFASNPVFRYSTGDPIIDLSDGVYYDGNSQGGIMGGTVCVVSIEVRRCALGVNGMDYSTLLPRSVDYVASSTLPQFAEQQVEQFAADPTAYNPENLTGVGYSNAFDLFYPDQAQRQLTLDIIQSLWDRTEPDGYATHMAASAEGGLLPDCTGEGVVKADLELTDCPTGTPDHHVLMQIAWGDHQVANITAFDEARTIGAESVGGAATSNAPGGGEVILESRLCNTDADGNHTDNDPVDGDYCYQPDAPLWGITPIKSYPYDGSAIAIFDAGPVGDGTAYATDPPPPSDVYPPDTSTNLDPHEAPRRTCAAQDMKAAFFDTYGQITGNDGYVTDPPQQLTGFVSNYTSTGQLPASKGTLAGPPYFSGGWMGTCALP